MFQIKFKHIWDYFKVSQKFSHYSSFAKYMTPYIDTVSLYLVIQTICVSKCIYLICMKFPQFLTTLSNIFYQEELGRGCRDFSPSWTLETTHCSTKDRIEFIVKGISHFFLRAVMVTYFPSFILESGAFACKTG